MSQPGQGQGSLSLHSQIHLCTEVPQNPQNWDLPIVQWLRFYLPSTGGTVSIPSQGTKIPRTQPKRKRKEESPELLLPKEPEHFLMGEHHHSGTVPRQFVDMRGHAKDSEDRILPLSIW